MSKSRTGAMSPWPLELETVANRAGVPPGPHEAVIDVSTLHDSRRRRRRGGRARAVRF